MQLSRLRALGDSAYPEPDSSLLSPGASSAAAFRYRHRVVPHLRTWHRKLLGDWRSVTRCPHQPGQELRRWVPAREAHSDTAPLCIALAYARSGFGPVNGKHLQEMLFFFSPPAALEVHRVVQFTSVDFRAGSCSSAGKTLRGPKHGAWRTDVQSSFPLPCSATRLPGAGLKMSSSVRRGPLTKPCQAYQVPCSWAFRRISLSRGARSLPSDGAVLQPPLRPDPAGEVGTTGSEGKVAHGSFCRPGGHLFPTRAHARGMVPSPAPSSPPGCRSRWPGHATIIAALCCRDARALRAQCGGVLLSASAFQIACLHRQLVTALK